MPLSNDDRGWIMTGLSGFACIFGASFICVDLIVRQFPGKKGWRIQDSDAFLSISLSLSFGVMMFSALYSMLPSSKKSLMAGGYSSREASWIMIGCFIGGVVGIQIISRFLHHFVPHNIVDCEHTHKDEEAQKEGEFGHEESHDHDHDQDHHHHSSKPKSRRMASRKKSLQFGRISRPETQQRSKSLVSPYFHSDHSADHSGATELEDDNSLATPLVSNERRPTLQSQITGTISMFTSGKDPSCGCGGPCYGYSDPCNPDCFKSVNARGGKALKPTIVGQRPLAMKSATATESTPLLTGIEEESLTRPHIHADAEGVAAPHSHPDDEYLGGPSDDSSATAMNQDGHSELHKIHSHQSQHSHTHTEAEHHHHHVPTNAFLSIGLQTSIAIALHKLPEGFITYATNHANPTLGFSVFLALFIHNITEGFAMALPLYLAINNRLKAMVISFVLGGLSQPLGAGVAAAWFKIAGEGDWAPSESGYGGMFAVTAGIMASVGLQLFGESLDMTHSKHLCMIGAFCGMGILGISSALTA